jgi:hypothetical protein
MILNCIANAIKDDEDAGGDEEMNETNSEDGNDGMALEEGNIDASYAYLLDSVRWVIIHHQSPISVMLSNMHLSINEVM